MLTHIGECLFSLFSLMIQMLIFSGNIPSDTPRTNVLSLSGYPLFQLNEHLKLIMTMDKIINKGKRQATGRE